MPALSSSALLHTLVTRNDTATAANATSNALKVICAFPVSGQYGPGSRILYYVLIAACVFARKSEWLRSASLAAALLFPSVAAVHGIVLAAVHIPGAVDMDVYGAFQLCAIGILAAPVTVRLSTTYFFDPGRNIIFLWTILVLAGLLSLTVEFFRINTLKCTHDDSGNPIFPTLGNFFSYNTMCNLTCSVEAGPKSPLRGGSANNIYVIPAPTKFDFNTATLLAAACCIPAVLSLVSMWNKVLQYNFSQRFKREEKDAEEETPIEGTKATIGTMNKVNELVKQALSAVEVPIFGGAVLAILIIGELNFFSTQVRYQTEPIATIGQWAPILGTGFAAVGSLYILFVKKDTKLAPKKCNCEMRDESPSSPTAFSSPDATDVEATATHIENVPTAASPSTMDGNHQKKLSRRFTDISDVANRRAVATFLTSFGNRINETALNSFDDRDFRRGRATDYPQIPGENLRNPTLLHTMESYNPSRDADGNATPLRRSGSFISLTNSERSASIRSPTLPTIAHRGSHDTTKSTERPSFELQNLPSTSSGASNGPRIRLRRDTLTVPAPISHTSSPNNSPTTDAPVLTVLEGLNSPAIVVSPGTRPASPVISPATSPINSPSELLPPPT